MKTKYVAALAALLLSWQGAAHAGAGTDGADFLNIPVGAEPVAMGGAYSALATNAYAPTWNPGAMSQVDVPQVAAQHISYLESVKYEYGGFVLPFRKNNAFGVSVQYLGTGDIASTDASGNSTGSISSHYGAYSLAYARTLSDRLSLGVTGKVIEAKLADVSASAFAADIGSYFKASDKLTLAGVVTNMGNKLTFLSEGDSLPLAVHLGGAYVVHPNVTLALEGVYPKTGVVGFHSGVEWRPVKELSLRVGYRTETTKGLSPLAGLTTGIGLNVLGNTLSYAWVPMGELGNTQYISFTIPFKKSAQ